MAAQEVSFLAPQDSLPGPHRVTATFILQPGDSVLTLPREFLIPGSERVRTDSGTLLTRATDYSVDDRYGRIRLAPGCMKTLFRQSADSMARVRLTVTCLAFDFNFQRRYALRTIIVRPDTAARKQVRLIEPVQRPLSDDLFGPGIQKSGTLVRGFTVATNRDLTLNSGFRMQLAGRLASDVDISAALTDENSPIQPEGTTQALREVDKVFVEIKNPSYSATLGDFNLQVGGREGGEFGRLYRKLQGARGVALFDRRMSLLSSLTATVTGATSRGKYQTNQFEGQDGVQGPYRLSGRNGERQIVVVAGSERVYLNGELMSRGEANDYVIDYASGEVTFASRRLMTNASRIVIDFEYTDRQFTRNLVGGSLSAGAEGRAISLNASFYQEADDPDAAIDVALDDQSRAILKQSGSDRLRASLPGVRYAGRDSLTGAPRGQYVLRDTLIGGKTYSVLVYAPGDSLALYSASFAPVDQVPADSAGYFRVGPGQFRFAGIGVGNYLPLQLLPMPQLHRVFDFNAGADLGAGFSVDGEFAASTFDFNRFSDSASQNGSARRFRFRYNPKRVAIFGKNFGTLDFSLTLRRIQRTFVSLDRVDEVEFNRTWNVAGPRGTDEQLREAQVRYQPVRAVQTNFTYGLLDRQGVTRSTRTAGELDIADSLMPRLSYRFEDIGTDERLTQATSGWFRQTAGVEYRWGAIAPGLRFQSEDRRQRHTGEDSLSDGSFRIREIAPRLAWDPTNLMSVSGEVQIRSEDSTIAGALHRAMGALTQTYAWQLREWKSLSSGLTFSVRKVRFTGEFRQRGNGDGDVLLLRSQTRYMPFRRAVDADVYYEFSNQKSSRLERFFMRVAKGTGNYRSLGDLNANGVADETEFEQTRFDGDYVVMYLPSEQLYPVADLKAGVRFRLQPERAVPDGSDIATRVLRALSTETSVRIDEKSRDPDTKQIYLLNFSRFLNDQTTINGARQFTQDLFLFENDRDLSFRFRFNERRGLLQLVTSTERSYQRERSMRIRSQLVPEISNQTDIVNTVDRVGATVATPRIRSIESNGLMSDFAYRPDRQWEVGLVLGVSQAENRVAGRAVEASMNEQTLRIVYAIPMSGQIRSEMRREEVVLGPVPADPSALPYELTGGKSVGKSWLWQASFDYRVTANVQLTVQYQGRSEGGRDPVHTARAEARAFF